VARGLLWLATRPNTVLGFVESQAQKFRQPSTYVAFSGAFHPGLLASSPLHNLTCSLLHILAPRLFTSSHPRILASAHALIVTMSEALKNEGNVQFRNGDYRGAITMYEVALALRPDPKLHLILLINRLNAYNKWDNNDSSRACEDILKLLQSKQVDKWKSLFGGPMLCKAFYQCYKSFHQQGNLKQASFMLRGS
jgi:tetratricopeptide (TPR) repeat protein